MNIKKLWMPVFALLLSSTVISAQEQRIKEEGKTEFKPHWFMQVQVGAAHTLGEAKFSDLISPAAAINVGYQLLLHGGHVLVSADGRQKEAGFLRNRITSTNICKVTLTSFLILAHCFVVLIPNVYSMVMSFSEED